MHLYRDVHYSGTSNDNNMEIISMFINRRMNKQTVIQASEKEPHTQLKMKELEPQVLQYRLISKHNAERTKVVQ